MNACVDTSRLGVRGVDDRRRNRWTRREPGRNFGFDRRLRLKSVQSLQ